MIKFRAFCIYCGGGLRPVEHRIICRARWVEKGGMYIFKQTSSGVVMVHGPAVEGDKD